MKPVDEKNCTAYASTNCTLWLFLFPISTNVGVRASLSPIPTPRRFSGLPKRSVLLLESVCGLISVRGLVALLTDTLLAIPTVAVCALPLPMTFGFR